MYSILMLPTHQTERYRGRSVTETQKAVMRALATNLIKLLNKLLLCIDTKLLV